MYSDRHPYTVVAILTAKRIQVKPDIATRIDKNGCVETMEANAHLMAAAPEMYEALKEVKGALCAFGNKFTDHIAHQLLVEATAKMDKALAKAESK